MTEKIQMTEEQFDKFMDECFDCSPHYMKIHAKGKGYIRKSELETLVEEAERMYYYWYSDKETNCEVVMDAMKIAIQNLKQSHPEFKK